MLRVALLALLVTACASPSREPRYVVLTSNAYMCGAADGLGCGLAIAPKLAEIDRLDGVASSGVSWDGRLFRIELAPGADGERVAAAVDAVLEGEACCVTPALGNAAAPEPDTWYDARRIVELSRHEAGVIAAWFAEEVAAEVALDATAAEKTHALIREHLERAFERAHAVGGGVFRLREQLPAGRADFAARLEFLPLELRARVLAVVDRQLEQI
ncbi:MAG: hypothetical protein EPO68_17535 [Planctomycetota bacterium]|nr:MAG: hypothetical protein EPO68_17535 [Planctomycetota bacterium]